MLCDLRNRLVNRLIGASAYYAEVRVTIDIDKDNVDFVSGYISRWIGAGPSRGVN